MSPPPPQETDPIDTATAYVLIIAVITYITLLFTAANAPPTPKPVKPWDKCTLRESPTKPVKSD